MKKLLIVVDMQKDFIDGSLGSKDAQAIVPAVVQKIEEYLRQGKPWCLPWILTGLIT